MFIVLFILIMVLQLEITFKKEFHLNFTKANDYTIVKSIYPYHMGVNTIVVILVFPIPKVKDACIGPT